MTENFEEKNRFVDFLAEIKELQRQEVEREIKSVHLVPDAESRFIAEELVEADMEMWDKVKREDVTLGEFREYKDRVVAEELSEGRDWSTSSRLTFVQLVGNRANVIINKDIINRYKKQDLSR